MSRPSAATSVAERNGVAEMAALPSKQIECLMQKIAEFHDLLTTMQIEASINAAVDQAEDRELVLERLPNGEYTWLRPDLTAKNRGPL